MKRMDERKKETKREREKEKKQKRREGEEMEEERRRKKELYKEKILIFGSPKEHFQFTDKSKITIF